MPPCLAVVLVEPQGDANIGAVARAMMNMGIDDQRLVDPVPFQTEAAFTWAVGARSLLEQARIFPSLRDAVADAACAVAFTRRGGRLRQTPRPLPEVAPWIAQRASRGTAALVFGREDAGLSTEDVRQLDLTVTIPTAAACPSLNLAQAVLIATSEIIRHQPSKTTDNDRFPIEDAEPFLPREARTGALHRMESALKALEYPDTAENPLRSRILHQLERLFGRAGLTAADVGMIEGLAARIVQRTANHKK